MDPGALSLPVINTVLLTAISLGVGLMVRQLGVIREQVMKTNGRVTVLETWRIGHEEWARDGRAANERQHGEIHAEAMITRKSVHDLRNEAFKVQLRHAIEKRPEDKG